MLTIAFAIFGLLVLFQFARARPAALLAALLIVFSSAYRIIDTVYLDLFGPVYATELTKFVGGGTATPFFVASMMCIIGPLAFMFRDNVVLRDVRNPLPSRGYVETASNLGLAGVAALIGLLYLDMLRIGVIPLLSGIDRLEYNEVAGLFHNAVYSVGFLPASALGVLAVVPRLQGKSYGYVSIALFMALLLYWALTGNRFSAFQLAISFFALPFAAIAVLHRNRMLAPRTTNDPWAALVSLRVVLPIISVFGALAIIGLLVNSYYEVRNYADPLFEIFQRVLIQPAQIYVSRWNLAATGQMEGFDWTAIDEVLLNPVFGETNTSMRYLMIQEVGLFRALELFEYGTQFAGGYPEIFLDLFGVYAALPIMLVVGIAASFSFRLIIRNLLRGYLLSTILAIYVSFAFLLVYAGGMLNSLLALSLAAKVVALIVAMQFERTLLRRQYSAASIEGGEQLPRHQSVVRLPQKLAR